MLSGESIICFSSTEWVGRNKTSKRYLMEIFSRTNQVLFIETIGSRTPGFNRMHGGMILNRIRKWWKGPWRPSDLEKDQNLWVYSPIVIPFHHIRWMRQLNLWILKKSIRSIMRNLDMKQPILWFYLPTASDVIGHLGEKKVVYHAVDEWSTYPGNRTGDYQKLDDQLFQKSDIVFASNRLLLEKKKNFNSNIHYLPHGVNDQDYKSLPVPVRPDDLKNLPSPIIAMIGAVSSWVDWGPLVYLANGHPDWSIVMLGPVGYDADLEPIKNISNIHLLGAKKYTDLPRYYAFIDVCVVSFLLTDHIRYCFPTRLYEHLASGRPVVSTDFPAAHEFPSDLVVVAKNPEEFERFVEQALKEDSEVSIQKRKQHAKENTWVSRAEEMSRLIQVGNHGN